MKSLQKYFLLEFFKYFFPILFFFISIFALSEFFWRLPDFIYYKPELTTIIQFLSLHIPLWCVQTLPLSVMLTTLLTISNFNYHRELIIITTLGINLKKFFLSWLFIGIIFSIFSFYLNDKIATKCFREGQNLFYTKVKKQPIENNIIKNLFYHNNNKKGVTTYFFLDKYDKKTSKIWHFILEEYKNDSLLLQIYAKEGIKQNSKIILYNCIIRHFDNHKIVSEKIVRRYIYPLFVDLENFRYDFSSIQLDQLNLKELKLALKIANYKNEPLYRIHTEISFRYAISFLNFILILFSIALGKNTQAQQGRLKCFIYTLIALIVYWLILSFMRTLGEIGVINPYFSVWLPNILFFLTGIFLYFKKE